MHRGPTPHSSPRPQTTMLQQYGTHCRHHHNEQRLHPEDVQSHGPVVSATLTACGIGQYPEDHVCALCGAANAMSLPAARRSMSYLATKVSYDSQDDTAPAPGRPSSVLSCVPYCYPCCRFGFLLRGPASGRCGKWVTTACRCARCEACVPRACLSGGLRSRRSAGSSCPVGPALPPHTSD